LDFGQIGGHRLGMLDVVHIFQLDAEYSQFIEDIKKLTQQKLATIQDKPIVTGSPSSISSAVSNWVRLAVGASMSTAPAYWSTARDAWICDFIKQPGNDLLVGAVSTMIAKVAATGWFIEGPLELAKLYRNILLYWSDFGRGWDSFVSKWTEGFLCRDGGGLAERQRTSLTDRTGPSLGFAHLDESKCYYTDDPEESVIYTGGNAPRKVHRANVMRIVDMPSGRDDMFNVGFCSVSRALTTAHVMMDLVRYKRERLSDLPPAGILFINNMQDVEWEDIMAKYDARQRNQGNTTWRDLMVAFGVDPAHPITTEMLSFSELPEHFNEKEAVELAVYTFALAFRMDARELWPVSSGPLGTATEAEIQHLKAKAKGPGIIFSVMERMLNDPLSLPQELKFQFDYKDTEEDKLAAEIAGQKMTNLRRGWEISPNDPNAERMLTTEEVRQMMVMENLVDPAILGMTVDVDRLYDVKRFGPVGRVYSDGRYVRFP
jgi:hypothetical protein